MKLRVLKKYRWIFAIQLLLLLLLLPGCMREEQLVFSDENVSVGESIDNCVYVGELFTAFPESFSSFEILSAVILKSEYSKLV